MVKLAPILKQIAKDVRVGSHHRSGSNDWKLHQAFTLVWRGGNRRLEGITSGPESGYVCPTPQKSGIGGYAVSGLTWPKSHNALPSISRAGHEPYGELLYS